MRLKYNISNDGARCWKGIQMNTEGILKKLFITVNKIEGRPDKFDRRNLKNSLKKNIKITSVNNLMELTESETADEKLDSL